MSNKAWVTLATNDTYSLGALVLAHSLKKVNTKHNTVVLVTSSVTNPMRDLLQSIFNEIIEVNVLDSGDVENLKLLARPELGITFTKLHCWRLTQYEKCVFLDADTLVLKNCDELFDREELSAAPDVGWPDCFNSGVFVFKPSEETYKTILNFALTNGSFDGGDQGLLNMYFNSWATSDSSKRLPFLYNLSSAAIYSYLPAFQWYGKGVKIVHFIANAKPWLQAFNGSTRLVATDANCSHLRNFLQYWWDILCTNVYPKLSPEMTRSLLRRWYTPQSPINYNSSRSNPFQIDPKYMNKDSIISETNIKSEIMQHFEFTDPWEEFEMECNGDATDVKINCNVSNGDDNFHNCGNRINESSYKKINSDNNSVNSIIENFDHCIDSLYFPVQSAEQLSNYEPNRKCFVSNDVPQDATQYSYISDHSPHSSSIPINFLSEVILRGLSDEFPQNNTETENSAGLAASFSQLNLSEPTPEQLARDDQMHRQNWEQGNIDYMGRDSFNNIWSKISETIKQAESPIVETDTEERLSAPSVTSSSEEPQVKPEASVTSIVPNSQAQTQETPTHIEVADQKPISPEIESESEPLSECSKPKTELECVKPDVSAKSISTPPVLSETIDKPAPDQKPAEKEE